MSLKDHYKTLGVPASASLAEIKKAYRTLAHQYHPDKAQENPFAASLFRDIQEAYSILSDEKKRRLYDEERYFSGLAAQKEPQKVTGEWLLQQARKLNAHMIHVDSYRMNHHALYEYVLLFLSDSHLAVLKHESQEVVNRQILKEILSALKNIHYRYFMELLSKLQALAASDSEMLDLIEAENKQRKKTATTHSFLPYLVIMIALLLCILMFFYGRRML